MSLVVWGGVVLVRLGVYCCEEGEGVVLVLYIENEPTVTDHHSLRGFTIDGTNPVFPLKVLNQFTFANYFIIIFNIYLIDV